MNPLWTRPVAVVVAALALAAPAAAAPEAGNPLGARLAKALAVPHVSPARSAAVAIDLRTGGVVYAQRQSLPLAPASTVKLPVSYALLVRLGPAYRIETQVLGRGDLDGTTWVGDLILKGYGDPTLSSRDLAALARAVRAAGIRAVDGAVLGDESFFDARRVGPGWKPRYYVNESPPLSALTVDRTRYRGVPARNPALGGATLFRQALVRAGVRVGRGAGVGVAEGDELVLATTASEPLLQLLRAVNTRSDNFTAEILLKHLGAIELGRGTSTGGASVVLTVLREAGVRVDGLRLADGSGLSRLDRLTADALAGILVAAWNDPLLRGSLVASLAVSGRTGTLEDRLHRVRGRVFAKTGTTSRASALAGYVNGRYAFAVVQNGFPVSFFWARTAQDRFVAALAAG